MLHVYRYNLYGTLFLLETLKIYGDETIIFTAITILQHVHRIAGVISLLYYYVVYTKYNHKNPAEKEKKINNSKSNQIHMFDNNNKYFKS